MAKSKNLTKLDRLYIKIIIEDIVAPPQPTKIANFDVFVVFVANKMILSCCYWRFISYNQIQETNSMFRNKINFVSRY